MLKIQTCVLRVDIHCEGCKNKVKKKLHKVEGVYKVSIDVEQGKVTVSGNVDPAALIEKLEKGGKHAELWGKQKGPISILNNQFKNVQIHNIDDGKTQKGGKDQQKNGNQVPQHMMHQKKGLKDEKFLGKEQKSVKFNLPEDDDDDEGFDEFDEDDDEFDDEFGEGFTAHQPPSKVIPLGHVPQANKANSNGDVKGKNVANNGGKGKKGGGFNKLLKGMLGKAGGKKGNGGKNHKKAENKKEEGSKNSRKNGRFELERGKNGATNGKGAAQNGNDGGKTNGSWSKREGDIFDGGPRFDAKQQRLNEINVNHKGGGGGGGDGRIPDLIGQMGAFQAVQGLPPAPTMNAGRFQGVGQGNPYNQQYMAHMMMMMNQQRENGHETFNPLAYTRPHPAMGYGPPPATDHYTHIFSDENTSSCSIM